MALVTVAELKTTLNIGDLYADSVLEQVIGAAEDVVLGMLTKYDAAIDQVCCTTANSVRIRTIQPHRMYVGQNVVVSGLYPANYNGDVVVSEIVDDNSLIYTKSGQTPLTEPHPIDPPGRIVDNQQKAVYDSKPAVREAALAIAVDIFQSRVAPGGQTEAVDFTPGPYRMGRSLLTRVSGLLGRYMDTSALVG